MPDEEKKEIAEFNESMLQIQRLHNLWVGFSYFRELGKFSEAREKLNSIEIELTYNAEKLDENKKNNYVGQLKILNDEISQSPVKFIKLKSRKGFENFCDDDENEANLKDAMMIEPLKQKALLLRKIQEECGMGSRTKRTGEDELE